MTPLSALDPARLKGIKGVLTDVDGTLTTGPLVTAATYAAVQSLYESGLLVIPITGGPAGMCMTMARMWPVNAVVGESGAFYFRHMREQRRMLKRFWSDEARRVANKIRIDAACKEILASVPAARLAADQHYREDDLAIDWAEDVGPLPSEDVAKIRAIMMQHGLRSHQSSIHVNGWIGDYNKLAMTRLLLAEQFGIDLDKEQDRFLYIGDAPNDSAMFEFFELSIGVANIRQYGDAVQPPPQYVTEQAFGAGFEEVVQMLKRAVI
jgi:HAD superfamily hydrolase (TIGR01484 family)